MLRWEARSTDTGARRPKYYADCFCLHFSNGSYSGCPVHPRTRPLLAAAGLREDGDQVVLTDPVGYLEMLALQRDAAAAVTDSGGVQEESCMLHTPCVTVRRNTERRVTIEMRNTG